jgi:hypothetical protein
MLVSLVTSHKDQRSYTKADIGPRPANGAESITRQVR